MGREVLVEGCLGYSGDNIKYLLGSLEDIVTKDTLIKPSLNPTLTSLF